MIEERLYSTGNDELDYILEKAFSDGFEYAQKEFVASWGDKVTMEKARDNKFFLPIKKRVQLKRINKLARELSERGRDKIDDAFKTGLKENKIRFVSYDDWNPEHPEHPKRGEARLLGKKLRDQAESGARQMMRYGFDFNRRARDFFNPKYRRDPFHSGIFSKPALNVNGKWSIKDQPDYGACKYVY